MFVYLLRRYNRRFFALLKFLRPIPPMVLCLMFCAHANAQQERLITARGVWSPAPAKLLSLRGGISCGYRATEVQDTYNNMAAFMERLHELPCLHPPKGFHIGIWASICGNGCTGTRSVPGNSGLLIRQYSVRGQDTVVRLAAEGPSVKVYFNDMEILLRQTSRYDNGSYEEPKIVQMIDGFPVYEGGLLVLTWNREPLFREAPVRPEGVRAGIKLVLPNQGFFRTSLPVSALQLVVIDLYRYQIREQGASYPEELIRQIRKEINIPYLAAGLAHP